VEFVTSEASPRIYGNSSDSYRPSNLVGNRHTGPAPTSISKNIYTLPYWIKKTSDGSLWFNELEGNKVARFDPDNLNLIEYWIPTQDRLWGSCANDNSSSINSHEHSYNNTTNQHLPNCGIANVIQFSMMKNNQLWFTEWSENKIGKLYAEKKLRFSIMTCSQKELTLKRGESAKINLKIKSIAGVAKEEERPSYLSNNSSISSIRNMRIIASGTFTSTGELGNSSAAAVDKQGSFLLPEKGRTMEVSFTFTPSLHSNPGQYTLMVGAENDYVSYLKAIKIKVL
jgi:virginiamycin B lyase